MMKFYDYIIQIFLFSLFLLNNSYIYSHIYDPVKDFKPKLNKRCNHEKKTYQKNYLSGKYERKLANTYYNEIQFQNIRIHFDYTYTLPYEEKIIRELVMPPVKNFYENTLSVRRFPGKIRFPRSISECQGIPVPSHLKNEGVDSDLVILVSTFRGMKKFYYDLNHNTEVKKIHHSSSLNDYLSKYFSHGFNSTQNDTLPWEINDSPGDIVGWSFMCLQDIYTLRPLAGVMQYVADINPTPRAIEEAIWTTLHEIMHVLVMDFELYADFIDTNFNRLTYDKTIRMKTRLKGLDKMLEERKDFLNDLEKFANYDSAKNENNQTENKNFNTTNSTSSHNSSSHNNSSHNNSSHNNSSHVNSNNTNHHFTNDNHNKSYSPNENKSNQTTKKQSNKLRKYENFNNLKKNQTENKNETMITQNNFTKTNNTSNIVINITNNPNITVSEFYILPAVELPLTEEYYEIKVPKNINLTVLVVYISNFLDHTKLYIKTPKVVDYGKKHFGCDSMDGVQLEHFGGLGSSFSHWSKRILNTEFMIADSYGENYISNFTLALLEDSGWYKVDYSKSEEIPWGKNKGCVFLEEKCILKKQKKNSFFSLTLSNSNNNSSSISSYGNIYESNFKEEFCTSFEEEKCSISRTFRAICGLSKHDIEIPNEYQYFDNPNVGGYVNFGDFCPYPIEWMDLSSFTPFGSCRNGIQLRDKIGEKVCENCRCFHSSLIEENYYKKNSNKSNKLYDETRAACYESKCRINTLGKTELYIIIDNTEIKCPRGGALLSVEGYKGLIECPKVDVVCSGGLDPKAQYTSTSAYNLFSHLSEKLLNILYDFIKNKIYS